MKCPNCDFIERDELFGSPPTCPKCGEGYDTALRIKALRDQQKETALREKHGPGASAALVKKREKAEQAEQLTVYQNVVIRDIDVPFWSIVRFMVKWAIAAIPAAIIIMVILTGAASILSLLS